MWKTRELLLNSSSSEQLLRVRQPFTAHYRNEIPLHVRRFVQVVSSVYIVPSVRSFVRVNNRVFVREGNRLLRNSQSRIQTVLSKQLSVRIISEYLLWNFDKLYSMSYKTWTSHLPYKSLDVTSDQYLMPRTFRNKRCIDSEHFVKIFIDRSFSSL